MATDVSAIQEPCSSRTTPIGAARSATSSGKEHLFVDNVRFWSMFAIIAMHCTAIFTFVTRDSVRQCQAVTTPFKFGTIAFFLISGFLLGERLEHCSPREYLKKRINKILLPWLFWFVILVALFVKVSLWLRHIPLALNAQVLGIIGEQVLGVAVGTAFWFVPNLLLGICILLLLRRFVPYARFGAILLGINLFYVANVYKMWIPSGHSEALFAFVFYLWLGTYAARHFSALSQWLTRVPFVLLLITTLLTGLAAYSESSLLQRLHSPDPLNTLRISNQIFSLSTVLLLLKVRRPTWPGFVNVRSQTFGLYLTHSMVMWFVLRGAAHAYATVGHWIARTDASLFALWVIVVAATYGTCLSLTHAINTTAPLRWMIGSNSATRKKSSQLLQKPTVDLPDLIHAGESLHYYRS